MDSDVSKWSPKASKVVAFNHFMPKIMVKRLRDEILKPVLLSAIFSVQFLAVRNY